MRVGLKALLLSVVLLLAHPALAQHGKPDAKSTVELGWSYFNKGDMDTALRRFNQALILDPDFAPAYFGIAYVYSVQNKLDLAIQNYRKSIEKDPSFSHSYSNLGLALLDSGRPKEALPMLKKALDLDSKNGDAHVNIAVYYFEAGEYLAAWKHVHIAQVNNAAIRPEFLRDLKSKMPEPRRPAVTPERSKGISIHMLPKQVADLGAQKWGLVVRYAEYLEPEKANLILQSATEFLTFVRKQKPAVQENGVWIVTTHPDAYSEPESRLLEDIKALCRREHIPLFVVRGSQLPNGWQRYDNAP